MYAKHLAIVLKKHSVGGLRHCGCTNAIMLMTYMLKTALIGFNVCLKFYIMLISASLKINFFYT